MSELTICIADKSFGGSIENKFDTLILMQLLKKTRPILRLMQIAFCGS
jgi:hypothetical protein